MSWIILTHEGSVSGTFCRPAMESYCSAKGREVAGYCFLKEDVAV